MAAETVSVERMLGDLRRDGNVLRSTRKGARGVKLWLS
jgi:hypothetical protein